MKTAKSRCASCSIPMQNRICRRPDGKGPDFCPTIHKIDVLSAGNPVNLDPERLVFARACTVQERRGYHIENGIRRPAKAPVTVLVAKDRVLGHNPLAAVYTSQSYYRALKP